MVASVSLGVKQINERTLTAHEEVRIPRRSPPLEHGAHQRRLGREIGGSDEYTSPDVTTGQVDFNHHKLTIPAGTTVKFDAPGTHKLARTVHPTMNMTIIAQ